jgi:hypothetical protein
MTNPEPKPVGRPKGRLGVVREIENQQQYISLNRKYVSLHWPKCWRAKLISLRDVDPSAVREALLIRKMNWHEKQKEDV